GCRQNVRRDIDGPPPRRGLRRTNDARARRKRYPRALDVQGAPQEVDITSLEAKDLSPSKLTPSGEQETEPIALRRGGYGCFTLSDACHGPLGRMLHPGARHFTGRPCDQLVRRRSPEHRRKKAVRPSGSRWIPS